MAFALFDSFLAYGDSPPKIWETTGHMIMTFLSDAKYYREARNPISFR